MLREQFRSAWCPLWKRSHSRTNWCCRVEDVLESEFVLELEPPPHEANVTNAASVINANAALR